MANENYLNDNSFSITGKVISRRRTSNGLILTVLVKKPFSKKADYFEVHANATLAKAAPAKDIKTTYLIEGTVTGFNKKGVMIHKLYASSIKPAPTQLKLAAGIDGRIQVPMGAEAIFKGAVNNVFETKDAKNTFRHYDFVVPNGKSSTTLVHLVWLKKDGVPKLRIGDKAVLCCGLESKLKKAENGKEEHIQAFHIIDGALIE